MYRLIDILITALTLALNLTLTLAAALPTTDIDLLSNSNQLSDGQDFYLQICCWPGCSTCGRTSCPTYSCTDRSFFTTCCAEIARGKTGADGETEYLNANGEVITFVDSPAEWMV